MAENSIILTKGEGISLSKDSGLSLQKDDVYSGELRINLNWSQPTAPGAPGIDLDLCCLFELQDGSCGSVQALGNFFGSLTQPPYISLDGDDRTGESDGGENLRLNMEKVSFIKRLLVFAYIYEGTPDWKTANPVVTLTCPGHRDVIVKMDEYGQTERACAIALLENHGNVTFRVRKEIKFFPGHIAMDEYYHWGIQWVPCRK